MSTEYYSVGEGSAPVFILSQGTWKGIITIQAIYPGRTVPVDLPHEQYSNNFNVIAEKLPINSQVRVGFKDGDYVSGTATIDITQ